MDIFTLEERNNLKVVTYLTLRCHKASLVAQLIKNPPAMWETWVRSLGWEDPPEESMATHSSILLENPHGQRSLAGYSLWGCKDLDVTA